MKNKSAYSLAKFFLILVFAIGLSRVFFLTVMMGSYFKDLADDNMTRTEKLPPIRGVINDKNGKPLALNIENSGKTIRFYPGGETIAGIVGYLGKPSENELKDCGSSCNGDTLLGKAGLEKEYERKLRGTAGEALIKETANGKERTEIKRKESVPGENITTNIDGELQRISFVALKNALKTNGKSGAVVIAKVSGEVEAFASYPSYDPNLFVPGGKRSDFGGTIKM